MFQLSYLYSIAHFFEKNFSVIGLLVLTLMSILTYSALESAPLVLKIPFIILSTGIILESVLIIFRVLEFVFNKK